MKAHAIVIKDNQISEYGFDRLLKSSFKVKNKFIINKFEAVTPDYVDDTLKEHNIEWNYPWVGKVSCFKTGLLKSAYQTENPKARIACALSHYLLWKRCISLNEPILILEHDSVFTYQLELDTDRLNMFILGINNPLGATRKSREYYTSIVDNQKIIQPVPRIDNFNIPQGLAGNSAYIIKPQGAERLIKLVKEFGLWPNDALMCYQLVPKLGVTRKFYTTVQGLKSTTTL